MKIVISGGLGYVGGRLSKYFAEEGHEVIALSRQAKALPAISWPSGLTIMHPEDVLTAPEVLRNADAFIHLAALNENDCLKYPEKAIEVNITQTLHWLETVYSAGIKKFIYFSTAHVYGKPLQGYYNEGSLTKPVHPYAITHKCAEDYVLASNEDKGMQNIVVRLTNSFGGPAFPTADRWTLLVNDLCHSAIRSGKMVLSSNGLQKRDFITLQDVCEATSLLMHQPVSGIFNLGSGQALSVWEMANRIKKTAETTLGKEITLTRKAPPATQQAEELTINVNKLKDAGFQLKNEVEKEIVSTLEYFRGHAS
jgi:UDP-glucose 4-epimerase